MTARALKKRKIENNLHRVSDGVAAMQYLRQETPHESARRPDLILLDLNMPRLDGKRVLREIDAESSLRLIPVVVLTTSKHDIDVLESYALHANAYDVKPGDAGQFSDAIQAIHDFWLRVATAPPNEDQQERRAKKGSRSFATA